MRNENHWEDSEYRALFDAVPIGLYRSSPAGQLLEVNRAFVEMLGFSSVAEMNAVPAKNHYADPADRGRWRELMDQAGVVRDFDVRLRRKDGSVLWVRESSFAQRDAAGRVISYQGALEDITREVERADELRRSEARFRALTENTSDMISVLAPDGTVLYDSPAIERVLGYSPAERVGMNAFSLAHPEDLGVVRQEFALLLQEPGSTRQLDLRMRHKDGSWRMIRVVGTNLTADPAVGGIVVNARDVSESAAAEAEVRTQRAFYEEILGKIDVDIAVFGLDLRFQYVNESSIRDPAIRAWIIGKTDLDYCRERGRPLSIGLNRMHWMQVAIDEARITELEEELTTRAGGTVHIIRRWTPVLDDAGRVTRLIGYGFDVTARRKAEQALQQRETELREAKKLEAVGKLAGGVAHDFNNLLTAIQGNAQLLLEQKSSPGMRAALDDIAQAAGRAAALTHQLLAFGRKQVLLPTRLDLNEVVQDMEAALRLPLGATIELRTELEPALWPVYADRGRIKEVITNLATNARDAMPDGGTLTLSTRNRGPAADEPARGKRLPGDRVVLAVADTGRGMDAETQERAFEPFYTTKEVGKGTGLGMSTVYGIVEQSGGAVFIDSELGRGTRVEVNLPRAQADAPAPAQPDARAARPQPRNGPGIVLVVEDEDAVRNLVRRVLERSGYQVLVAENGDAAIEIVRERVADIDLLLSDVVMPGMDGPALRARLLELRPALPTIFMSGYSDIAVSHQGVLDPDTIFIEKPFTAEELIRRVQEILGRPD